MRISTRLSIATIVILAFSILGTAFVSKTSQAFDKLNFESNAHDDIVLALTDFRAASRQIIVETYQSLYLTNGKDRSNFTQSIEVAKEKLGRLKEAEKIYELKNQTDSDLHLETLKNNLDDLISQLTEVLDDELATKSQKSKMAMRLTIEDYFKKKYLVEIAYLLSAANKKNNDIQALLSIAAEKLAYITPLGLLLVFLLSAAIFIPLSFVLKNKVGSLMAHLDEFDFDSNKFPSIPLEGKDEFSYIGARFNQLFSSLKTSKYQLDKQQRDLLISSRMASLGEMSAGVAHEINNPLAVIVGNIHLLHKYIDCPEKLTSKVELLDKSCKRIIKIVNGLKKFSRSGMQTSYERKSFTSIVKEALVLTEGKSKRHITPVEFEVADDFAIDCDEIEIEQVLVNLVNNAIDAVKDGDERWVKIMIYVENDIGVARIVDSGLGILESVQEKIFDPFFTTKSVGQGTGLGLSITRGILEAHKATIIILKDYTNTCFEIKFNKIQTGEASLPQPMSAS